MSIPDFVIEHDDIHKLEGKINRIDNYLDFIRFSASSFPD